MVYRHFHKYLCKFCSICPIFNPWHHLRLTLNVFRLFLTGFLHLNYLKTHKYNIHPLDRPHICDKCGKAFALLSQLQIHFKKQHETRTKVECPLCHKFVMDMYQHKYFEHRPKFYGPCEHCGKEFEKGRRMNAHVREHHMGRKYTCTICDKDFKLRPTYTAHMDTHTGKKYPCRYCPFESTSTANRVKHYRHKHLKEWEEDRAKVKVGLQSDKML